jgi:hypothetical protein
MSLSVISYHEMLFPVIGCHFISCDLMPYNVKYHIIGLFRPAFNKVGGERGGQICLPRVAEGKKKLDMKAETSCVKLRSIQRTYRMWKRHSFYGVIKETVRSSSGLWQFLQSNSFSHQLKRVGSKGFEVDIYRKHFDCFAIILCLWRAGVLKKGGLISGFDINYF